MTPTMLLALAAAFSPSVAEDCARIMPEIEYAAEVAELPVATMLALVALESRCQFVEDAPGRMVGPAQVHWAVWGPLLAPEGWYRADLLGPWGGMAGGRVLEALRDRWQPATDAMLLCLYSDGSAALRYETDCTYSRRVLVLAKELER